MNVSQKIVKDSITAYFDAFHRGDIEGMNNMTSVDYLCQDHIGRRKHKKEMLDGLKQDSWKNEAYEINDLEIILSDDEQMALARYQSMFRGSENQGDLMEIRFAETLVFRKEKGIWKLLHMHYSMVK